MNETVTGRIGMAAEFAGPYLRFLEALCGAGDFGASAPAMLREIVLATGCEAAALCGIVNRITGAIGQPILRFEPVDVRQVLEDAVRTLARHAEAQGVRIVCRLTPGLPAVNGDAPLLGRAMLNILVNAVEAMPSGGVLRLELRSAGAGRIEVLVVDSGPGVPSEPDADLFKPFRNAKPDGAGPGLSAVRRVLELHGGEALLRPIGSGGTEVLVAIPVIRESGGQP